MWYSIIHPVFDVGSEWTATDGSNIKCKIVRVDSTADDSQHLADYDVTYEYPDGVRHTKDAWCFQIRYKPVDKPQM